MQTAIEINARPHPSQKMVHIDPARFKVLAAGRRWGKTRLGVNECMDYGSKGKRAWWVAPSYKMGEVGWRPLRRMGGKVGAEIRKVDRQVVFPNGGEVTVRSADEPNSLRGEGLDLVILDECAFMSEEAWTEALRPALSDRAGKAIFISTPKGRNWFWRLFQRGVSQEPGWACWQLPTSDNPYIPPAEIDAAKGALPERVFQQEYLAEFIDDAGGVFRRVMEAATATHQDAMIPGHQYAIGSDWGKYQDFTALTVLDLTIREVVTLDRFNMIDYAIQVDRLRALVEKFRPGTIIAERNSMGEPLIEQLQRDGLPVQPFQTTNATKQQAIDALALAFERGSIKIPNDPVLIGELQAYEAERLPSGLLRYSAPEGMHDDTVMSLALVWQATSEGLWWIS